MRGHACSFCPEEGSCQLDKQGHDQNLIATRLAAMGRILLVMSNKGGVGKSTVAANLAAALARQGHRVGLGDADIHGPNAGVFFGVQGERVKVGPRGIGPIRYRSQDQRTELALGSLAMLLPEIDVPVVWRDAYKFDFIHHLIGSFNWGELDYLILDMPPGTGNELITLCDLLEGSDASALLVTSPQAVALHDSLKAARFCRERGLPILGWVENMAGLVCPHCGGEIELFPRSPIGDRLATAGIPSLAQLPLSPQLAFGSDAGTPVVLSAPDSLEAGIFDSLARCCVQDRSRRAGEDFREELAASLENPELLAEFAADDDATRAELSALLGAERERLRPQGLG
jgi:Mrp family chromosome partitioning ATPase